MGIRHLQTFQCQDVSNGYFEVHIENEIRNYIRNHKGEKPIIVIDMIGLIQIFSNDKYESLCGGRHATFIKTTEKLFQQFVNAGANLVLFVDGRTQEEKYYTWGVRQNEKYRKIISILDDIKMGKSLRNIVVTREKDIPNNTLGLPILKDIINIRKYGKIYTSFNRECDMEIAKYAKKNNALAVIADDTDFLIFKGDWKYWSAREINIERFTTMQYDRIAIRRHLNLTDRQMVWLATIAGNDVIRYDDVKKFHDTLGNRRYKFYNIAKFVRNLGNSPNLDMLAKRLFSHQDYPNGIGKIQQSLASYDLNYETDASFASGILEKAYINGHDSIYSILNGFPINVTLHFVDLRKSDLTTYFVLVSKIVRKNMGVLLQHQNNTNITRFIYTKQNHETPYERIEITPEYPTETIPDLEEFLYGDNSVEMMALKYRLLQWIISEKIDYETIKDIPKALMTGIITLVFLVENKQFELWEADLFLLTINDVVNGKVEEHLPKPSVLNHRMVRIVFLFLKIYGLIRRSLNVVGLRFLTHPIVFDGYYFHNLYDKIKDVISDAQYHQKLIENIQHLRLYAR